MNIPKLFRRLSAVVALLFVTLSLSAQDTQYFVESISADVNGEVAVNVRGISIDTLVGVQFSVQWDPTLLDFVRVDNITLDGSFMGNFNRTQIDEGRIGYLEADGNLVGFGLPDSDLLFTWVFSPQTTVTTATDVTFAEDPLRTSARSSNNNEVDPILTGGTISLNGANSLATFSEDPRLTIAPNPFRDYSQLNIRLDYGGAADLEILDANGRRITRRTQAITPGNTTIDLYAKDFPTNGAYIVRITTEREQLHRKVIVQGQ
ncbi:MAG: T9SS type A sorting domain-containing protein [Bacteroidota bacterium]